MDLVLFFTELLIHINIYFEKDKLVLDSKMATATDLQYTQYIHEHWKVQLSQSIFHGGKKIEKDINHVF